MLHEHKAPVKKHSAKQLKFKRIKEHAKELVAIAWTNAAPGIRTYLATSPPQSAEQERSVKALLYAQVCDDCLQMAEAFEAATKRIKGKYMAD